MTAKSKTKRTKMKRSPQERIGLFIVHVICITAGVLTTVPTTVTSVEFNRPLKILPSATIYLYALVEIV